MDIATDRLGVLVDQLEQSAQFSKARLEGLTDHEYRWEPVPGMWSVRARGEAATGATYGPGDWVLDYERVDPFAPGPVTTIAWRIGHLTSAFAGRWEWTFGGRQIPPEEMVDFSPHAEKGQSLLWQWIDRWGEGLTTLTDDQLDQPGFGQYPYGLDPQIPFIGIIWWQNRELIHHLAEVALLRDLYPLGSTAAADGLD